MIKAVTILLILASSIQTASGQMEASVSYSTDTIKIGEQFFMSLFLTGQKTETDTLIWPEFDNNLTDDIEIIGKSPLQELHLDSASQLFQYSQKFVITSFKSGTNPIPSISILYDDSTYITEPYQILVNLVEIDTSKGIYDIKPIMEVDYKLSNKINDWILENWYWVVIGILLLIISLLTYKYFNRPKPEVVIEAPKIPAHISALTVLQALAKSKAWENDDKKMYYSSVTDTVRKYLEERFDIQAMEETTIEIIKDLKYSDIISKDKFFLQEILKQADMVKFAKFKPDNSDGERVLEKSIEFVNRTKLTDSEINKNMESSD